MFEKIYDVIQVGFGPVSAGLALMLGKQGCSIAIVEKWEQRYHLPRAVCIDHELYRVLSANGMGEMLPNVTQPGPSYEWFNADWKLLLSIDWSAPSISGGPETYFVHQPTLEAALEEAVSQIDTVQTFLGYEVVSVNQDKDFAYVTMKQLRTGQEQTVKARFVVGCDGANSIVRNAIDSDRDDKGFEADWLVIDVLLKNGVTIESLNIPAAAQYCNPTRPTTIVPAGARGDEIFRRWEFMRLPSETREELENEEKVWELLKPWAGPDDIELVRHKVYNFRSLIAQKWRVNRVLIAGDAAHVMPPFMGQGMCAGLRDAWNLAWKLPLILNGKAFLSLLDTYQKERYPHVVQVTDISIYLGKMICTPDVKEAAERDVTFFNKTAPPPPTFPCLTDGIIHRGSNHKPTGVAGFLSPHVEISRYGEHSRLDDYIGGKFAVLSYKCIIQEYLTPVALRALNELNTEFLVFDDTSEHAFTDESGRLTTFFEEHSQAVLIVRPDCYIYGGASPDEDVQTLIDVFINDLNLNGIAFYSQPSPDKNPTYVESSSRSEVIEKR